MQIVDSEGFIAVRRGVRQQEANLGDFIQSASGRRSPVARTNRFRELTVDDLNALSTSDDASRGGGHLLLKREADPKLVDPFPPLTPSGQGEKDGVSTRRFANFIAPRPMSETLQAQTETDDLVASLHDPILRAIMSDHPLSRQDMKEIKDFSVAREKFVGFGGQEDKQSVHDFVGV